MAAALFATAAAALFFVVFGKHVDEAAIDFPGAVGGVALIGIDVHGKRELGGDADDGIAEDGGTAIGLDDDEDVLAILNVELLGVFGGHMDMALGDDRAFFEKEATAVFGVDQGDGGAALDVAREADRGFDAEGASIGGADFDLIQIPKRSEDGNAGDDAGLSGLGVDFADDVEARVGHILAGLGEHLADLKFGVLAFFATHEVVESGLVEMDVTSARLNEDFVFFFHYLVLLVNGTLGLYTLALGHGIELLQAFFRFLFGKAAILLSSTRAMIS